jgi:membrane-associated phospholipid phosphatase
MRLSIARAVSILGHPLCLVPMASLIAMASHGSRTRVLWAAALFFLVLSLIILTFSWWQVRVGRWQHVDAIEVPERRSLNYCLTALLFVGAFISFRQSQPVGLTLGLLVSGCLAVLVMLFSAWVKVSLHVAFSVYSTALLWYSGLWFVAIGLCLATAVAWSRLELRRHALVEVLMGGIVGGVAGLLFWVLLFQYLG